MGLEHIEVGAFCNLRQISILNLNENYLQSPPELCALKCCFVTLSVADNNISTLDKHFFRDTKKLETLHLSNNKLALFPNLHWTQHSLKSLLAAENKIESMDMFKTTGVFELLQYIDMGGNNIRMFDVKMMGHMPKLLHILLHHNKLTSIDDFRIYYKNAIYLSGDPWHCETALPWMGEDDIAFGYGLTCETPACLQGIAIAYVSKYKKQQHIQHVQVSVLQENLRWQSIPVTIYKAKYHFHRNDY